MNKLRLDTPYGYFDVSLTEDENYPGVDVEFVKNNDNGEHASRPRVLFEFPKEGDLRALIWTNKDSEDYTHEFIFDGYSDIIYEEANDFIKELIENKYFDVYGFLDYMRKENIIGHSDLSIKMTMHLMNSVSDGAYGVDRFVTLMAEATGLPKEVIASFEIKEEINKATENTSAEEKADISSELRAVNSALESDFEGAGAFYTYFEAFHCTKDEVAEALVKVVQQYRGFDPVTIQGANKDKENIFTFVVHGATPDLAKDISKYLPGKIIVGYIDWDYFGIKIYKDGEIAVPDKDFQFACHTEACECDDEAMSFAYRITVGDTVTYGLADMVYENDIKDVKCSLTAHATV